MAVSDRVREAIEALPAGECSAIRLAYLGGHTYREVAIILDEPEGTVKSRIRSGLKRLKTDLVDAGLRGGEWAMIADDAYSEVLGAYALDAVEPEERADIERHLAECPRCRAEVAEHREVTAFLSQAGAPAPAGVWDRIVAELSPPAPPLRMSFSRTGEVDPLAEPSAATPSSHETTDATVTNLADHPRRRLVAVRTAVAALAVAAAIIAVLGIVVVNQNGSSPNQVASIDRLAQSAVGQAKLQVRMNGKGTARAVVQDSGQGFLIRDDLPKPAKGDVYQLWGQVDGTVLSLGTFGGDAKTVSFHLDPDRIGDVQSFSVTQEHAPGVVASVNRPVVAGNV